MKLCSFFSKYFTGSCGWFPGYSFFLLFLVKWTSRPTASKDTRKTGKTTKIIQSPWHRKPRKRLRAHKYTIKYIGWILHHCFARHFVMFLEFFGPRLAPTKSQTGLKASEDLYKIPNCYNLGCPPPFLTHVLDFVEASLLFNPCLGFCRGPHPPPKHCQSSPMLLKAIKKHTRFPWCVLFSVKGVLNWNVY